MAIMPRLRSPKLAPSLKYLYFQPAYSYRANRPRNTLPSVSHKIFPSLQSYLVGLVYISTVLQEFTNNPWGPHGLNPHLADSD